MLNIQSVQQPTQELLSAASESIRDFEAGGNEFSKLVLPIKRTSWVECDGTGQGALLLEGSSLNVTLKLDLDQHPTATYHPA